MKHGWHRHSYTIVGAPHEDRMRVTGKASGDYTSRREALLAPGMPAMTSGPHGRIDWQGGTRRQIWVGAGVGIASF